MMMSKTPSRHASYNRIVVLFPDENTCSHLMALGKLDNFLPLQRKGGKASLLILQMEKIFSTTISSGNEQRKKEQAK